MPSRPAKRKPRTAANFDQHAAQHYMSVALGTAHLMAWALMIVAAWGDLWFDEIWSLALVKEAKTWAELLTRFHHDNNHLLNSVFLQLMGDQKPPIVYRLLAVLSGMGSISVIMYLAKPWGNWAMLFSVLLAGTSYPLTLYFSEARGYAPAIFFALLSYSALLANLRQFKLSSLLLFWTTNVLGILAHLTFLIVSTSLLVFSLARPVDAGESPICKLARLLILHLPPVTFFGWFYLFFVQDMVVGGGPTHSVWSVIRQASALLIGFPEGPLFSGLAMIAVLAIMVAGVYNLYSASDGQWLFYLMVLFVSPIVMLIITQPQYLYFRYFVVCFPFFYLLLAHLLAHWYGGWPKQTRPLVLVALAILIAGQMIGVFQLLVLGRGSYTAALARIAASSPAERPVRIGSTHDFQNQLLVEFFVSSRPELQRLRYVAQPNWDRENPDWLITHSQHPSYRPPPGVNIAPIGTYMFVDTYRFSGISGWNWFLYRREPAIR